MKADMCASLGESIYATYRRAREMATELGITVPFEHNDRIYDAEPIVVLDFEAAKRRREARLLMLQNTDGK